MYIDINSCATIVSKSFFLFLNLFRIYSDATNRISFSRRGQILHYLRKKLGKTLKVWREGQRWRTRGRNVARERSSAFPFTKDERTPYTYHFFRKLHGGAVTPRKRRTNPRAFNGLLSISPPFLVALSLQWRERERERERENMTLSGILRPRL